MDGGGIHRDGEHGSEQQNLEEVDKCNFKHVECELPLVHLGEEVQQASPCRALVLREGSGKKRQTFGGTRIWMVFEDMDLNDFK